MKKLLSIALSLCMVLGMSVFAVSAAEATEIKDGTVIEFEAFAGEENKDLYVFENLNADKKAYGTALNSDYTNENGIGLSGGGALNLGERTGATSMVFTIPVSVTEPGWYEIEWYGTDGGAKAEYLSNYTVALGDAQFAIAGTTITEYFKPEKGNITGGGIDLYYYPVRFYQARIYVAEDTENLVITATDNTNGTSSGTGVKMLVDCMKFDKYETPTASAADEAVVEMEDLIPYIRYTFPEGKSNSAGYLAEPKASGGALMNMEERSNICAIEFDVPVKIENDGWYALNLVANSSNAGDTSVLRIKNGEEEWVNNWRYSGYAGTELLYFGTAESHLYYGIYDHKIEKYLTAGEYNLTASAVSITNQTNATKFLADCLKISPVKTDIPAEGKRVELEKYREYMLPRKSGEHTNSTTGETYLTDLGGDTTGFETVLKFAESGYYDVTFHGSPWNNNGLSKVNFYLGDNLLMNNDNAKYGVSDGYLFEQYLPAWTFTKKRVYIKAGENPFKMEVITRDPNSSTNQCAHASDYLEFTRVELPKISETTATSLEMEDYIDFIRYTYGNGTNKAKVADAPKASGGKVLDMIEKDHITAVEFDIPFVVTKSGWYKVNLVASTSDMADTSVLYIKNGDEEWVSNWVHSGYVGKNLLYFGTKDDGDYQYYGVYDHQLVKYIEAGEYTLTASASAITKNPNATKFLADCLKFEPLNMEVSDEGKIELEDLQVLFGPWKPTIAAADGNADVSALWAYSGETVKAELPITFPESGYYDISFFGTPYKNNGLSKINIYIDGELIMDNDETKGGEALGYNYKEFLPAYRFDKYFVYIEKGTHNVTVEGIMRNPDPEANNECAFGMDAITFKAVTEEAVVDTNAKSVHVTTLYDAPVSGEIVVASYVGDEMVGFDSFTETNINLFDVIVSYNGAVAPDTVKVFVWKDLTDVVPVMTGKVFEIK